MDVLLLLGSVCGFVALWFAVSMVVLGSMAARSPQWHKMLYVAALHEVQRRRLITPPLSQSDYLAYQKFVERGQVDSDPDADRRIRQMLKTLTEATGEELGKLETSRKKTLRSSLGRQICFARWVRRISNHRLAACGWRVCAMYNSVIMGVSGLRWFLPLFLKKMRRIGEPYLSDATFSGVWLGLLCWSLLRSSGLVDSNDWLGFVGGVITLGVTIGLMVAIVRQLCAMLDALRGPNRSGKSKIVFMSGVGFIILITSTVWLSPEILSDWPRVAFDMLWVWLDENGLSTLVGGLFFLIALGWMIRGAIRSARKPALMIGSRIEMVASAAFLIVCCVLVVMFLTGASSMLISAVLWVNAAVLLAGCISICVANLIDILVMYCNLHARNVAVPRKGFRWWMLVVWFGVVFGGGAMLSLLWRLSFEMGENYLLVGLEVFLVLLVLTAMVAALPAGFVVAWLYGRRVRRVYRETFASSVPPRAG